MIRIPTEEEIGKMLDDGFVVIIDEKSITKENHMNDKEKELWRVIDNVIKCCAIELPNGELSITREDVLGKSRAENLVMTRCMVVEQMIHAGFSITTIATVLNRTVPAVRHLCKMAYTYISTSRVYRLATAQATLLNKDVEPICI